MPYPPKQEKAIFLDMKRKKGVRAARNFIRKHSSEGKAGFEYSRKKRR